MARQAVSDVNQAFNIFLDTISSAFGGIIFISLLVCVQLQMTGGPAAVASSKELQTATEKQIRQLREEIEKANRLRQAQIEQIRALGPMADNRLVREYLAAMVQLKKLQDSYQAILAESSKAQQRTAEMRRQLEEMELQLKKLIDRKEQDLKKGKTENLSPPVAGVSNKKQVAALISGGRLEFYLKYDDKGLPVAENGEEVSIEETGGQKWVRPRPDRGLPVSRTGDMTAALASAFGKFTAAPTPQNHAKEEQCHAVSLVVWPDSYKEAEIVRNFLISKGFEYGLLLMPKPDSAVKVSKDPAVVQTFGHNNNPPKE